MRTRNIAAGFTLIELLVVVAIIMVLAAILFPVINNAADKGRQATCVSNQRQICQGMQLFAQDNHDALPPAGTAFSALRLPAAVLTCPSMRESSPVGYVYNTRVAGRPIAQLESASRILLTADGCSDNQGIAGEAENTALQYRHHGKLIAGYLDGHAATCGPADVDLYYPGDRLASVDDAFGKSGIRIYTGGWGYPPGAGMSDATPEEVAAFLPTLLFELSLYPTHVLHQHDKGSPAMTPLLAQIVICHTTAACPTVSGWSRPAGDDTLYLDVGASARTIQHALGHQLTADFTGWSGLNPAGFAGQASAPTDAVDDTLTGALSRGCFLAEAEDRIITFSYLMTDPNYVIARGKFDPSITAKADFLKSRLQRAYPAFDGDYWTFLTRARVVKRSTYTPLTLGEE